MVGSYFGVAKSLWLRSGLFWIEKKKKKRKKKGRKRSDWTQSFDKSSSFHLELRKEGRFIRGVALILILISWFTKYFSSEPKAICKPFLLLAREIVVPPSSFLLPFNHYLNSFGDVISAIEYFSLFLSRMAQPARLSLEQTSLDVKSRIAELEAKAAGDDDKLNRLLKEDEKLKKLETLFEGLKLQAQARSSNQIVMSTELTAIWQALQALQGFQGERCRRKLDYGICFRLDSPSSRHGNTVPEEALYSKVLCRLGSFDRGNSGNQRW